MLRVFSLLLTASLLLCTACDLLEMHPYEGVIKGAKHLTESNLSRIATLKTDGSFTFAFISDTQRHYADTEDAVSDINARQDVAFVLHGGDLTDFGLTDEFSWMRDRLVRLSMPWLTIIGNHDYLGHGDQIYRTMFGPFNYTFTFGHVRFIALNTVALELDYSTPIPDFGFLEREASYLDSLNTAHPDSITRTIFFMHSRPGDEQFNNNVSLPFDRYLRLFPGMDCQREEDLTYAPGEGTPILKSFCLNGHNHRYEVNEPYMDGIRFYGVEDIHSRQYLLITIHPDDSHEISRISF